MIYLLSEQKENMIFSTFLFYMLSAVLLSSAILVVTARDTVHSVLFLILSFLNAAGLFILMRAEFLAMVLIIVYVGAVAVLFLFVVMMLSQERGSPYHFGRSYRLIGFLVAGILVTELLVMGATWKTSPEAFQLIFAPQGTMTNTEALGHLLYTHYVLVFQLAGLVLLIAMMGAIVLTLRHREGVLKQNIQDQLNRNAKDSLRLVDFPHAR